MNWMVLALVCLAACSQQEPRQQDKKYEVGLCMVATGKYNAFAQELIESARRHFLTGHHVTYYIFTDGDVPQADDIVKIPYAREGWPYDSLKRFHAYYAHWDEIKHKDYLFAIDADMRFESPVGDEIFGDLVGVRHPGFLTKKGTFEKNKSSAAYVPTDKRKIYFAGGFYGGKPKQFHRLLEQMVTQVNQDMAKGYIAIWHDESHLNSYFSTHIPKVILPPSYCYPEHWGDFPYERKLVACLKNHEEARK